MKRAFVFLTLTGDSWHLGETLSCVIGQSFVLSTPLQLAMAYATIANGGTLYRPHILKEIFSNSGEIIRKSKPEQVGEVSISPKTSKIVKKGLYQVVNARKGTAWWYRGKGIQMAAKVKKIKHYHFISTTGDINLIFLPKVHTLPLEFHVNR